MRPDQPYETNSGTAVLWACRQAALWGALAVAIYLAIGYRSLWLPQEATPAAPEIRAASIPDPGITVLRPPPTNTLTYRADHRGHVAIDAAVNGGHVRFLVDTGATLVALSMHDAAAAGISRHQLDFSGKANTANGQVRVAPITLREIRIGQLSISDVRAAVIENLDRSLLGMSFLKRLKSYEMRDSVLTITW